MSGKRNRTSNFHTPLAVVLACLRVVGEGTNEEEKISSCQILQKRYFSAEASARHDRDGMSRLSEYQSFPKLSKIPPTPFSGCDHPSSFSCRGPDVEDLGIHHFLLVGSLSENFQPVSWLEWMSKIARDIDTCNSVGRNPTERGVAGFHVKTILSPSAYRAKERTDLSPAPSVRTKCSKRRRLPRQSVKK